MLATDIIEANKLKVSEAKRSKKNYSITENQNKLIIRLRKKDIKTRYKQLNDCKLIISEILSIKDESESLKLISNSFDSPNILTAISTIKKIHRVYISTWAITEYGILQMKKLSDQGIEIYALMDDTHSYKWLFQSGAAEILKNVKFQFTANHSKFILIELAGELPFVISGSMNMSNNPRYENIEISRNRDEFDFYRSFIMNIFNDEFTSQKSLL